MAEQKDTSNTKQENVDKNLKQAKLSKNEAQVSDVLVVDTSDTASVVVAPPVVVELPPHILVSDNEDVTNKKLGTVIGTVFNCISLRIREGANAKTRELAQIPVGTKVKCNLDNSTESFYEVTYSDGSYEYIGYCMKTFISLG